MKQGQMKQVMGSMRRKMGPVGLSLIAAALTATAFAGVSVAQNNDGDKGDTLRFHGPGAGGPPMLSERLSEEDRAAMEEFRQCLEDNGAPAMPEPPDPSEQGSAPPAPPEPPSEEDRAAMEKAFEACEDKAPDGAPMGVPGHGGPGGPGGGPCGPPPGTEQRKGATS